MTAFVPWGEEAYAGNLRLGFIARAKREGSPLLLLAPVLLLAAGMAITPKLDTRVEPDSEVDAPSIALPQVRCTESEPARAEHRARVTEQAGRARAQRFPFATRDGVEALDLLVESAACYRAAGRDGDADRLQDAAATWFARLDDEYASARLRLRVALDQERHGDALSAARHLQALLSPRPASPYSEWLAGLSRRLERRLARSGP